MKTLNEMESNLAILTKEEVENYGYCKLFIEGKTAIYEMDVWSYPELNNFISQDIIYEYHEKNGTQVFKKPVWLSDKNAVDCYGRLFSVAILKKDFSRNLFQVRLEDIDDGDVNYFFDIKYTELYEQFKELLFKDKILDTRTFVSLVYLNKDKEL